MIRCNVKPYEGNEKFAFISYSHKDKNAVFPIIEHLVNSGYRIWYDEGIEPGSEWPETIADHLNRCTVCIAFISKNSLDSHNCRREINFALQKKKYFISIMIEPVDMSLGMEMQISSTQSIYKYVLPSDKEFYNKLYDVKSLLLCKNVLETDLAQTKTSQIVTVKEEVEQDNVADKTDNDLIDNKKKRKATKKKPPKVDILPKSSIAKKKHHKAKIILLSVLAFLLVVIVSLVVISAISNNSNYNSVEIDKIQITDRMLWGEKILESNDIEKFISSLSTTDFCDITINGEIFNISSVPVYSEINPANDNIIKLGFVDKFAKCFYLYGSYKIENNILTMSPTLSDCYDDAYAIESELQYQLEYYYGCIKFYSIGSDTFSRLDNKYLVENDIVVLDGMAKDGDECFEDIRAIKLNYSLKDDDNDNSLLVFFADGAYATNSEPINMTPSISHIGADFREIVRLYNGRLETFEENKHISFHYILTYPYGFILVNNDESCVYYYQESSENLVEPTNFINVGDGLAG